MLHQRKTPLFPNMALDAGHSCPKSRCHLLADPRCYSSDLQKPNITLEVYVGLLTLAPSCHKIEQYQMFLRKYAPYDQEKKVHQSLEQTVQYEVLFIQSDVTSNHYLSVFLTNWCSLLFWSSLHFDLLLCYKHRLHT